MILQTENGRAAYDPITRNIYITQDFGELPKVNVYHIDNVDIIPPAAPAELNVQ